MQQKPASLYLIALEMGCLPLCGLWTPWDFITQRQMDDPGAAEFWGWGGQVCWGEGGLVGLVGVQAISLISGRLSQVAWKHAARRPSERQRTTKEVAHLPSSGSRELWQSIRAGSYIFHPPATGADGCQNSTATLSIFPDAHDFFFFF